MFKYILTRYHIDDIEGISLVYSWLKDKMATWVWFKLISNNIISYKVQAFLALARRRSSFPIFVSATIPEKTELSLASKFLGESNSQT